MVAHRGASGYAPEHTAAAYLLALRMKADFVEQDLQMTRDGALVCSHDAELSRTTDIARVFPDRATERDPSGTGSRRGWYAVDFTLAELKTLDAGSWFNRANPFASRPEYEGQKIQTLEEAIATVKGRAGLYIETKHVDFYGRLVDRKTGEETKLNQIGTFGTLCSQSLDGIVEFKEFFVKLTDKDLNLLIGSLAKEDISKMDLPSMLRVLFRLNPKLLWDLRHLVV